MKTMSAKNNKTTTSKTTIQIIEISFFLVMYMLIVEICKEENLNEAQ